MEPDLKSSKIVALDFFDDLTSPYARRWFVGGLFALSVLCIVLLFLAKEFVSWPDTKEVVDAVLVELLSNSILILAFYFLYVYFIGPNAANRAVSVIRPQDISERVRSLPVDTGNYIFWGRSGSFFRAYSLLELDKQAKSKKKNISVDVLLPDPGDDRLVSSYRDILKSLGEDEGANPLLPHVLATCMVCAILSANNKHLEIRVHLSRFLPAFRVDLSDAGAILTQDDKKKSALYFEPNSEFYDMFATTIASERGVSQEVKWDKELFFKLELDESSCDKKTLGAFGIAVSDIGILQQKVAHLISKRPHRYA